MSLNTMTAIVLCLLAFVLWAFIMLCWADTQTETEKPRDGQREAERQLTSNRLFLEGNSAIIWGLAKDLWEAESRYGLKHGTLFNLAECESSVRHDDIWGDNGDSYGMFQWQLPSWRRYCKEYKTELNILNLKDQIELTARVIADGGWFNWKNCLGG